jgi:outer membrane lipoprotein
MYKVAAGCTLALALLLAGCATYPDVVRVSDESMLVSYSAVVQNKVQKGTARWSGVIASVKNNATNTRLEIVYFPAGSGGRPQISDQTPGRFVAYVQGFVDPLVYAQGKPITVLGQLAAPESGHVEQYQYLFPVIQDATVYLWPKKQEHVEVDTFPMWDPFWGMRGGIRVRTTIPVNQSQDPAPQGPSNVKEVGHEDRR